MKSPNIKLLIIAFGMSWSSELLLPGRDDGTNPAGLLFDQAELVYQHEFTKTGRVSDGSDRAQDGQPRFAGPMEARGLTHNNYQYVTYYEANGTIVIERRNLDEPDVWEKSVVQGYRVVSRNRHNKLAIGISSGDGVIHLAFDHHNTPTFNYARTAVGVAENPEEVVWDDDVFQLLPNLGLEDVDAWGVTYPLFIPIEASGDMIVYWRSGGARNGEMNLAHYSSTAHEWSFIAQISSSYGFYNGIHGSRGPYVDGFIPDSEGNIHVAWIWREDFPQRGDHPLREQGIDYRYGNHGLFYAVSRDGGFEWFDNWGEQVADTRKGEKMSIDNVKKPVEVTMDREPSNMGNRSAIDPKTGDFHMMHRHYRAGTRRFALHHYVRSGSGEWSKKVVDIPGTKIYFHDDWLFLLASGGVFVAERSDGFKEWRSIPFREFLGDSWNWFDTSRFGEGIVSVLRHRNPEDLGEPTPIEIFDFKLWDGEYDPNQPGPGVPDPYFGANLSANLSDVHHLRYDFGTNFDPPVVRYNASSDGGVGTHGNSEARNARSPIHGFELPVFEDFNGIHSGTYTVTLAGDANSPNWNAQLYLFKPGISPPDVERPEDIFWANSAENIRGLVRTVDLGAITPQTEAGTIGITLTSEMLEGFYDEKGIPVSEGGKIWFRLSEGREPSVVSRYETVSDPASPNAPSFTVTTFKENIETIPAALTDTNHMLYDNNDSTATYLTNSNGQLGGSGAGGNMVRGPIQGFTLPVLTGPPESAIYEYTITDQNAQPLWNGHIYIFNPDVTPSAEAPDAVWWANSQEDDRGLVRTVSLGSINPGVGVANPETIRVNLTSEMLDDFYDADGNPVSAEGKIWFRLSPGKLPVPGWNFNVQRYNTSADSARLTVIQGLRHETEGFADWVREKVPKGFDQSFAGSAIGDGIANGIKFAFGLDPMTTVRLEDLLSTGRDEAGRLTITYRVNLDREGVSVKPEVALTLGLEEWFREKTGDNDPYVSIGPGTLIEGNIREFTATSMNIDETSSAFMRVSVELCSPPE